MAKMTAAEISEDRRLRLIEQKKEIAQLNVNNGKLRSEILGMEAHIERLRPVEQEKAAMKTQIATLKEEIDAKQMAIEAKSQEAEATQVEIKNLRKANSELRKQLDNKPGPQADNTIAILVGHCLGAHRQPETAPVEKYIPVAMRGARGIRKAQVEADMEARKENMNTGEPRILNLDVHEGATVTINPDTEGDQK